MRPEPTIARLARTFDALIAAVLAGTGLLLFLSVCGCTVPFWETDEEVLGVAFDWGAQSDRATADELLCFCAAMIGDGRLLTGARVKFSDDVDADCQPAPAERGPIGGCWSTLLNDMVVLAPAARLVDTALCHELAHRARHYAKGQMPDAADYNHCDRALWNQFEIDEPTGPCPKDPP